MTNMKFYIIGKILLWVMFLMIFMHKVLPIVPQSWNLMFMGFSRLEMLIKWRPFIYIILNLVIVFILISSSFTHKLNNLIQKIHKKSSHNISSLISQTSQKLHLPFDDNDNWWSRIGNNEEKENYTPLDEPLVYHDEEKTVSFEPRSSEKLQEVKEVDTFEEMYKDEESKVEEEEEEEEVDTMEATWKAIMEAKNKGNGPYLKKSGTWTAGDRGSEVANSSKGRLSRYKVELKKWSTFSREVVHQRKNISRDDVGGAGAGAGSGWRGMESGLTFHDELKKRADAFIARVTHDMRLQRMESDQRVLDRVNNRGVKSN